MSQHTGIRTSLTVALSSSPETDDSQILSIFNIQGRNGMSGTQSTAGSWGIFEDIFVHGIQERRLGEKITEKTEMLQSILYTIEAQKMYTLFNMKNICIKFHYETYINIKG